MVGAEALVVMDREGNLVVVRATVRYLGKMAIRTMATRTMATRTMATRTMATRTMTKRMTATRTIAMLVMAVPTMVARTVAVRMMAILTMSIQTMAKARMKATVKPMVATQAVITAMVDRKMMGMRVVVELQATAKNPMTEVAQAEVSRIRTRAALTA